MTQICEEVVNHEMTQGGETKQTKKVNANRKQTKTKKHEEKKKKEKRDEKKVQKMSLDQFTQGVPVANAGRGRGRGRGRGGQSRGGRRQAPVDINSQNEFPTLSK
eukprot:GILI01023435.1.p3 GENE.GILI01023435.1~~GILI01023435.1.p3  ORF type:complete len:105 (+),score=25.75 GILI01023435.1:463-777(+)